MPWLCLIVFFMFAFNVHADDLKIHGFVAQGVIQAQDSNFVQNDGEVSLKLTEIGLNGSYKINNQLRVAGQGVYLNGGNRYPEGFRVDYLFLEWKLLSDADWQLKLQLGRNKNYHWLYSATRDVPHTRPSIVLAQSMYFDAFRDFALGVDGIMAVANTQNAWGEWDINLSYGSTPVSNKQRDRLLGVHALGKVNHDKDMQASIFWRPKASQWQFGVSLLEVDFSYDAAEQDIYFDGATKTQRMNLHFLYQSENWEFASEFVREKPTLNGLFFPSYKLKTASDGGYVQGRYFLNPQLTLMTRLDLYDRDRNDRSGKKLEALSDGNIPAYFGYMDQLTLGLTWKFAKNIQVQTEYHRVKGTGHLAPYLIPNTEFNQHEYWDMWAIQLMYWY
ncbi:MAG: TonB-dependent receptor [Paraglaciecola sp.]|uniref:TonB-dependent receptor n=1 Tax=Paraglaciecola sp. TaxID=1920173 RepID=UPI00273FA866|nr:TonB-dependent receptor [Paraglaciecola sp.]MDP5029053.1 TonB-dependent receptor [Paraglaciecola sp.]MDP5129626.1 TonB-dependent receptor [Paraglaciecola sp.]